LLGGLAVGCHSPSDVSSTRQPAEQSVVITKTPVVFASHTFDPLEPPSDMPPLSSGETAVCDSDFLARASVRGRPRRNDATHATMTITQVRVRLELRINIWLPGGATQFLTDHEDGHRQIAEYYYQNADKVAERIAGTYIGRRVELAGTDLDAESSKALLQAANDIADEYTKEINSNNTQLNYDAITDHSRNGVLAKDAVEQALKNAAVETAQPTQIPGN
jgi:hypothetical protein